MAHGMFKIKVIKFTNGEEILNYAAPTYPQAGERLYVNGKMLMVASVSHMVSVRDAGTPCEYHTLDYVEVTVSK